MYCAVALTSFLVAAVAGQQAGTLVPEVHPPLPMQKCVKGGTCTTEATSIVLDANWRWLHTSAGQNCYTGNTWSATACPDPVTCAANCALDGAQYASTYGITTSGNALTLDFVTGANVGSRNYLMASPTEYQEFMLMNQEFTFDVDVSNLPCGLNGALYFSQMAANGDASATNLAGAAYGTGYCDSQCPQDIKFINGKANIVDWAPDSNNANTGKGDNGACCFEMDIWEANSQAAAYTPHNCANQGLYECTGAACGNNPSSGRYTAPCDKDGCDFNSWRMGNETFLGPGMTVDTTKPFTVVTQFITSDGTATGTLTEIRRIYEQNGVVIQNSNVDIPGMSAGNSITDQFCNQQKAAFVNENEFETMGGLAAMGTALKGGMVLVMSLWDDYSVDMLWLDSDYPTTASPSTPGISRGPCSTTSGNPPQVESQSGSAKVIFSNIKVGDLGSTYGNGNEPVPGGPTGSSPSSSSTALPSSSTPVPPPSSSVAPPPSTSVAGCSVVSTTVTIYKTVSITVGGTVPTTSTPSSPTTSASSGGGGTVAKYGQCGGTGWTGGTVCASGSTCTYSNQWYSQCL